jgi:type VI secretion system protein ImpC
MGVRIRFPEGRGFPAELPFTIGVLAGAGGSRAGVEYLARHARAGVVRTEALEAAPGDALHSRLRREYEAPGGRPFGLLVADYDLEDLELLEELAEAGARAHAPVVAGVSPRVFGAESFEALRGARRPEPVFEPSRWRRFRESENARYCCLALPRITRPVCCHAGFVLAGRIAEAFGRSGWCAEFTGVEGGGLAEVEVDARLDEMQEAELASAGFATLLGAAERDRAAFFAAPSCHARIRLPHTLAPLRVVQYLRMMANRGLSTAELNEWLGGYVGEEPDARRPLAAGWAAVDGTVLRVGLRPGFRFFGAAPEMGISVRLP